MFSPIYLIAFSGHRPENQPGRTETDLIAATPRLRETLRSLGEKAQAVGCEIHIITSLAAGSDIIACETAASLNIPVHIVLAKPEAAFLETYHHVEPAKNLDHWLPRARAILATIRPDPDFPDIPINPRHTIRNGATSTTSPECYAEANTRLLEPADLLLTISTLQPSKSIAGTTHLIGQAEAIDIPVLNINPADPSETPVPPIPGVFANPDCHTLATFRQLEPHLTCGHPSAPPTFAALAKCLSAAADNSSRWYRRASAIAISSHALATIIAAAAASFYYFLKTDKITTPFGEYQHLLAIVAFIEVILVYIGWDLERRLHKKNDQKIWLRCRFARELMRSMENSNPFLDPLYPEIQRHQPHWKRFAITTGLLLRTEKPIPFIPPPEELATWRNRYLENRVLNQEEYFRDKSEEAHKPALLFHHLTHYSGLLALIFVAFAFLVKFTDVFRLGDGQEPVKIFTYFITALLVLFLPIFLPLLASLGASFGAAFDYSRRASRYHEIAEGLSHTARILPTLETLPDIASAVRQTEETLQSELIEWFAAQKKGLGH